MTSACPVEYTIPIRELALNEKRVVLIEEEIRRGKAEAINKIIG